jgi:hypothetical protein
VAESMASLELSSHSRLEASWYCAHTCITISIALEARGTTTKDGMYPDLLLEHQDRVGSKPELTSFT